MIGVAVIGAGYMGRNHARVVSQLSSELDVELRAIVDLDRQRAEHVSRAYGGTPYGSLEELLGSGTNIDAAIVATPTITHVEVSVRLLEAGIEYILVEKPLAESAQKAEKLLDAAGSSSSRVMVGHIERFNPAVQHLLASLGEGLIGEPISYNARRVGPYVSRIRDVGVVMDLATHEIDLARLLLGSDPLEVYARTRRVVNLEYEDSAVILLSFENASALIEVNRVTPYKERKMMLTGTKAVARLDYIEQKLSIHTPRWEMDARVKREEPLKLEDRAFLESVVRRREVPVPLIEGYRTVLIAEYALKSSKLGSAVKIPDTGIQ